MDKGVRNSLERATQRARRLLEEDFASQLEGDFDVLRNGGVAATPSGHLSPLQAFRRDRIVTAIEHKRASGMTSVDSVVDYLRDAAFTTLNRFVALKMLEARELVQECITKGEQSAGYGEFCGMAPGLPLLPDSAGYRLYIESLFDELSTEVKVLFDRRDPSSVLWPKRATFERLLEVLNTTDLTGVWGEDETIGWVYQFFNGQEERKRMREESQAPRNSRELAVRNQFFTPRYVVQFLTDNTLGRIWYEMRGTQTVLAKTCKYLVRKPGEEFAPRTKKDPRDLRVLDPACGSGHFLLYAFDLLLEIYEEAHGDPDSPKSEATGKTLAEDYPSPNALRNAVPGLVLAHNLHGVDIDPRCAQIAQLALWIRAQKAYQDLGVVRSERVRIRRSSIVVAEPLITDDQIGREFVAKLGDAELRRVFGALADALKLAGNLGLLLRVDQLVARPVERGQTGNLFAPPEERIRAALAQFVAESTAGGTRRRLFVDDAAQGLGLLNVAEKRFDAVLMNPPFGLPTGGPATEYVGAAYDTSITEISVAFCRRASELLAPGGACGVIAPRSWMLRKRLERFRRDTLIPRLFAVLDLGPGVLDAAIDVAAYVVDNGDYDRDVFSVDRRSLHEKSGPIGSDERRQHERASFIRSPSLRIVLSEHAGESEEQQGAQPYEPTVGKAIGGLRTFCDARFIRLWWEVTPSSVGRVGVWQWFARTDGYSTFFAPPIAVVKWNVVGRELQAYNFQVNGQTAQVRQGSAYFGRPGAHFMWRSQRFCPRLLPAGCLFSHVAPVALPTDPSDTLIVLGWLSSENVRRTIEVQAHANAFTPGLVKLLPWINPSAETRSRVESATLGIIKKKIELVGSIETYPTYRGTNPTIDAACRDGLTLHEAANGRDVKVHSLRESILIDAAILSRVVDEWIGTSSQDDPDAFKDHSIATDEPPWTFSVIQYAIGHAFNRWRGAPSEHPVDSEWLLSEPVIHSATGTKDSGKKILHDDEGHGDDVVAAVRGSLHGLGVSEEGLQVLQGGLRQTLRLGVFGQHIDAYSAVGRKAPIYWQLATPSASYSVWLYIHAFSKDTLFRVQNDYAAPKLAHEERRLESISSELRDGATTAQRKELAAQEGLVDELRAFLDEVKRVAPLWKPNLDDGVVINFAPLWRLVPQNKPWQKELKSTWDSLCDGKYDWAHLAMHLWPERVVPKCAKDRSLAIAHGLEEVFWVEGSDGKWTARETPTHSVDDLVQDRTSTAVKSALKSLLEAPAASGAAKKTRKGRAHA